MKLDVAISDTDHITLNFNGNAIGWIQHTRESTHDSIEWAGRIANKVTMMFPNYKLMNFSFVSSTDSGCTVTAQWQLNG